MATTTTAGIQDVLDFWFNDMEPERWFVGNAQIDDIIRTRFSELHRMACACELAHWRDTLQGRLAEIIVIDQFSRNLFRNSAQAFAHDALALALAQEAIRDPAHLTMPVPERAFLYIPFMHAESLAIHETAMALHSLPRMEARLPWEIKHRDILQRFGRYPHRNAVLGRTSSAEEIAFLATPGSSF